MEDQYFKERKKKLEDLKSNGINPYPYTFDITNNAKAILEHYQHLKAGEETQDTYSIAGRIVLTRPMGKIVFMHILDASGKIQILLKESALPKKDFSQHKSIDLGDFVGIKGTIARTRMGEISVIAQEFTVLCKSLRPLPEKYHGLKNVETRYRKRYIDLIMNPEVRETFRKRTIIIKKIREILDKEGFLEVETPVLQPIYGGASAQPFTTKHIALDMTLYLRISNELYLKRLLVGGFEKVYEVVKDFRNEGIDTTHNPEFTMIEWYEAYKDYTRGMELFERIYEEACIAVHGTTTVQFQGKTIDFKRPWTRRKMTDLIAEYANIDVLSMNAKDLLTYAEKHKIEFKDDSWGMLVQAIFEATCESHLQDPIFVIDHPIETTPLCKQTKYDPRMVERFEPFANGWELGNAYSELNDPELQKKLLQDQVNRRKKGEEDTHPMDEDFIEAIETGMPPASGVGLGIDRMIMLLTDSPSIRDVILFPTMKNK